jgi:hypothetical protein
LKSGRTVGAGKFLNRQALSLCSDEGMDLLQSIIASHVYVFEPSTVCRNSLSIEEVFDARWRK